MGSCRVGTDGSRAPRDFLQDSRELLRQAGELPDAAAGGLCTVADFSYHAAKIRLVQEIKAEEAGLDEKLAAYGPYASGEDQEGWTSLRSGRPLRPAGRLTSG